MVRRQYIPAVIRFSTELGNSVASTGKLGSVQRDLLAQVSELLTSVHKKVGIVESEASKAKSISEVRSRPPRTGTRCSRRCRSCGPTWTSSKPSSRATCGRCPPTPTCSSSSRRPHFAGVYQTGEVKARSCENIGMPFGTSSP